MREEENKSELIENCIEVIRQEGRASTSLLQRRFRIGYVRAQAILGELEKRGIVGPVETNPAAPRKVLNLSVQSNPLGKKEEEKKNALTSGTRTPQVPNPASSKP